MLETLLPLAMSPVARVGIALGAAFLIFIVLFVWIGIGANKKYPYTAEDREELGTQGNPLF